MKTAPDVVDFDISSLDAADEGQMTVCVRGIPTTWIWTFAGPGHPKTVALAERVSRERLRDAAAIEQAQVNGKKWKSEPETVDAARTRNVNNIVERIISWTPAKINGQDYPFSAENARALLLDPKKDLFQQSTEFLAAEASFTPASVTK